MKRGRKVVKIHPFINAKQKSVKYWNIDQIFAVLKQVLHNFSCLIATTTGIRSVVLPGRSFPFLSKHHCGQEGTMVDWSDGPLHRIVLPMVDNHRKLSGHNGWETQKPTENHQTRWLPPTIPFNGDGCFENHWKTANFIILKYNCQIFLPSGTVFSLQYTKGGHENKETDGASDHRRPLVLNVWKTLNTWVSLWKKHSMVMV